MVRIASRVLTKFSLLICTLIYIYIYIYIYMYNMPLNAAYEAPAQKIVANIVWAEAT